MKVNSHEVLPVIFKRLISIINERSQMWILLVHWQ